MAHSKKQGGRKLENDKPLDRAAAAQQRTAAQQMPEFAQQLASELDGDADPVHRLLIEAALLDDFGYYQARDLLIEQIAAQTKP